MQATNPRITQGKIYFRLEISFKKMPSFIEVLNDQW